MTLSTGALTRRLNVVMAIMCGTVVSNLYYAQPLLPVIADDLAISAGAAASVVTLTQAGYACGLVLIVPLGDIRERRHLIQYVLAVNCLALCAMAIAPSILFLQFAAFIVGLTTVVVQVLVPFAADLADDASRGRAVGVVMGGLFAGILASRIVSGLVADIAGWRAIYGVAAVMIVLVIVAAQIELPLQQRPRNTTYGRALRMIPGLVMSEPQLRRRSLMGGLAMAALMAVWSTIAFPLSEAPFKLDEASTGLLGLAGIVGITGANLAGRSADRGHHSRTAMLGLVAMFGGLALLSAGERNLALIITGLLVLDFGPAALSITNQSLIYRLQPQFRSAITTVYVSTVFIGASTGSFLGATSYARWGLDGVCSLGAIACIGVAVVLVVDELARRRRKMTATIQTPTPVTTVATNAVAAQMIEAVDPPATRTSAAVALTDDGDMTAGSHFRSPSRTIDVWPTIKRLRVAEIIDGVTGHDRPPSGLSTLSAGASVVLAIMQRTTNGNTSSGSPTLGNHDGIHFRDARFDVRPIPESIDAINAISELGDDAMDEIESRLARSISQTFDLGRSVIVTDVPRFVSSHPALALEESVDALRPRDGRSDVGGRDIHLGIAMSRIGQVPICSLVHGDDRRFSAVAGALASRAREIAGITDVTTVYSNRTHPERADLEVHDPRFGFIAEVPISRHRDLSAFPLRRYQPLDQERCPGTRVIETEALVFGRRRRVVLLHSEHLQRSQRLHYDDMLQAACRSLGDLATRCASATERERESIEAEITEILSRHHVGRAIHVDILGDDPSDLRIAFKIDQRARTAFDAELFGKKVLFTDRANWTTEEIVEAFGSRSATQAACKHLGATTIDHSASLSKLRAQALLSMLTLAVVRLARLEQARLEQVRT